VNWLGGEADERVLSVTSFMPNVSVGLEWTITTDVETEESIAAREAYEAEYAETPIGVEIPEAPEPRYEERVIRGSIQSESLADAHVVTIPELWTEGDGGIVEDSSLIWFSVEQYDELVNTRKTHVSLGLFDESLSTLENVSDDAQGYLDAINAFIAPLTGGGDETEPTDEEEVLEEEKDLTQIEASGDFGQYTLMVDDVRTTVQTIEAKNSFASYTILANRDNPLILEIKLTPLAEGSLKGLSPTNLAEGFSGYEVTQIHKTSVE